jgi:hypothetical protein
MGKSKKKSNKKKLFIGLAALGVLFLATRETDRDKAVKTISDATGRTKDSLSSMDTPFLQLWAAAVTKGDRYFTVKDSYFWTENGTFMRKI